MPIIRANIILQPTSLNPVDRCVNTLHFNVSGVVATEVASIATAINGAYEAAESIFANTVSTGAANVVNFYDLSEPEPRAPVAVNTFGAGFVPGAGNPLPAEVALCLSFQAAKASGLPQARRRGRIFLGPLGGSVLDSNGRPTSAARVAAVALGDSLLTSSQAAGGWNWVVYSPTTQTDAVVLDGWVDNAFDIQRRRGVIPTSRNTFS